MYVVHSWGEDFAIAFAIPSHSLLMVLAATFRKAALNFAKTISIGLRFGL